MTGRAVGATGRAMPDAANTAVVIGGGNGIGEATCRLMHERGLADGRRRPRPRCSGAGRVQSLGGVAARRRRRSCGHGARGGGDRVSMGACQRARRRGGHLPGRPSAREAADGSLGAHAAGQPHRHLCGQSGVRDAHGLASTRQHRQHRVDCRDRVDACARVRNEQGGSRRADAKPRRGMGARRGPGERRVAGIDTGSARRGAHPLRALFGGSRHSSLRWGASSVRTKSPRPSNSSLPSARPRSRA